MKFDKLKTILIHIPKTGGTTITYQIAKRVFPEERKESSAGRFIMSLYTDREKTLSDRRFSKAHIFASDYKKELENFDEYYSFAIIRNPFSQIISLYRQLTMMDIKVNRRFIPYKHMSFRNFVMGMGQYSLEGNSHLVDQTKYVLDEGGNLIVTNVFCFDYYNESVEYISNKIGVPINIEKKWRETEGDETYSPEMIERVLDLYGHVYDFYKIVKKVNVLPKTENNFRTHP